MQCPRRVGPLRARELERLLSETADTVMRVLSLQRPESSRFGAGKTRARAGLGDGAVRRRAHVVGATASAATGRRMRPAAGARGAAAAPDANEKRVVGT